MKASSFSRHKRNLNANMNVVPYIDVMLVLLVIFMITAPMLTTGVDVNLPKEKTSNIANSKNLPVIVSLKQNGEMFVSHDNTLDEPMDDARLTQLLTTLIASSDKEVDGKSSLQVMVNADQHNEYSRVMHLMAIIQQSGVSKVGLLTANSNGSDTKKSKKKS